MSQGHEISLSNKALNHDKDKHSIVIKKNTPLTKVGIFHKLKSIFAFDFETKLQKFEACLKKK